MLERLTLDVPRKTSVRSPRTIKSFRDRATEALYNER